jgi:hypothetical protein
LPGINQLYNEVETAGNFYTECTLLFSFVKTHLTSRKLKCKTLSVEMKPPFVQLLDFSINKGISQKYKMRKCLFSKKVPNNWCIILSKISPWITGKRNIMHFYEM